MRSSGWIRRILGWSLLAAGMLGVVLVAGVLAVVLQPRICGRHDRAAVAKAYAARALIALSPKRAYRTSLGAAAFFSSCAQQERDVRGDSAAYWAYVERTVLAEVTGGDAAETEAFRNPEGDVRGDWTLFGAQLRMDVFTRSEAICTSSSAGVDMKRRAVARMERIQEQLPNWRQEPISCEQTDRVIAADAGLQQASREFAAPDRSLRAVVTWTKKSPRVGDDESTVAIFSTAGRRLFHRSYESPDGQHGFRVERAAWTPDSRFFVVSLSSSGGHQPWHSPTDFWCRGDGRLRSLDTEREPITTPEFTVETPDVVVVADRRVALSVFVKKR